MEVFGVVFIILLGSIWHFIFDWSGGNTLVGLVAPVNESVWEHFKIGVYPALLFAGLSYGLIGKYFKRYWLIRALNLYLIPIFIAILFYTYTALLGYNLLVLDIMIFVIAVVLAQFISYRLMIKPAYNYRGAAVGVLAIVALLVILAVFTLYPPHHPIFIE